MTRKHNAIKSIDPNRTYSFWKEFLKEVGCWWTWPIGHFCGSDGLCIWCGKDLDEGP